MGLARLLPRTEMLVVTTPPVAAQKVAARAADMARRGYLRVAGVIENMSDFTCEHGTTYALFGSGGGERLAHGLGVPLIGSIPLHPDLAAGGDAGMPVALAGDDSELGAVFEDMARVVAEEVAPLVDVAGLLGPARSSGSRPRWRQADDGPGRLTGGLTGRRRTARRSSGGGPAALDGVLAHRRRAPAPTARPSWPRARRWAHREKRATGSSASVTSP